VFWCEPWSCHGDKDSGCCPSLCASIFQGEVSPEDVGGIALRNGVTLPQHWRASQSKRPRHENLRPIFKIFCRQNSRLSELQRRVVWWLDTNVSEDHAAYFFRVEDGHCTFQSSTFQVPTTTLHSATTQKTADSISLLWTSHVYTAGVKLEILRKPTNNSVRIVGATSTPQYAFMAWC